jgi:hypothetical protein
MLPEGDPVQLSEYNLSREHEEIPPRRDRHPLLEDISFALDLDGKPEKEWSRYEKRRMRRLSERIIFFRA